MLRDKLKKITKIAIKKKPNNRKLAISLNQNATPFLQTRRFFADKQENFDQEDSIPEEVEEKVSISEERDKVFTEKKMSTWDHVKVALHHIKKGFATVGSDSVYLAKLLKKKQLRDDSYSVFELRERRRISKDLVKFIPYSIFMTIPFLEAFLPIYMILFPNSMPTQFMFESQVGKKTSELVEAQQDAYNKIIPLLPKFANVIGLDPLKFVQSI
jgi:LETM1 and EF-hand domain-containing protein 1